MSFALQQPCRRILLVVIAGASLSTAVQAQTNNGRISGTVVDISGAVTPGVTVTVRNEMTRLTRAGATNGSGFYIVTNLPVGDYSVTAERQGFKKAAKTGYKLVADGRLSVNFRLEPGLVNESVEVIAAPGETINSTSGEVARVIDGAQAQELALNGRNYMQLATLIPGAPLLSDDQLALMVDLSGRQPINGQRGNANSLSIDGGSNLDSGDNGAQNNNVGIDFIREVNIKTSNFSAEYGRQSGAAINVVTRSGGNQIHGAVYQYSRNDIFDANNSLNNARGVRRAALRYNNFSFSLGGPVIKERLFLFGGMEWKLIRRFSNRDLIIPSALERRGDFSVRRSGPD
ncbi:MAG: carboxypeptidase regulatory-like domain-containing protein, partial [Blastocatellia bacterium]